MTVTSNYQYNKFQRGIASHQNIMKNKLSHLYTIISQGKLIIHI